MSMPREDFRVSRGISRFTIATLTARLIYEYDSGHSKNSEKRDLAADLAALLCRHYDEAYQLVRQNAENYAGLMCDYDASPYHPNSIAVIGKVTNRPEAREFLQKVRSEFCGLASHDANEALADFDAATPGECPHLDSRDWEDSARFEAWKSTLTEKEKRSLDLYFAHWE